MANHSMNVFSACTKGIPKLKDFVNIETIHSPGTTYKWRAIKVSLPSNGRDYSNLKQIPNSRTENGTLKVEHFLLEIFFSFLMIILRKIIYF